MPPGTSWSLSRTSPFQPEHSSMRFVNTSLVQLQIFSLTWSSNRRREKPESPNTICWTNNWSQKRMAVASSRPPAGPAACSCTGSRDRCQQWQLCFAKAVHGRQLAGEAAAEMTASLILSSTDVTEWPFPVLAVASLLYSIMAENKSLWVNLALLLILNDRNCH